MGKVTEVAVVTEITGCSEGVRETKPTKMTGCDMDFCAGGMICGGICWRGIRCISNNDE
jgi:hypothetical protein